MGELPATFVEGFHNIEAVKKMTYRSLGRTGMVVSKLSFGASSLGSVFRDTDDTESIEVVHHALKSGINYIDVAPWYGQGKAETVLGKALKDIPRKAYFIATKVCRYEADIDKMFDFTAERTIQSVDESLERLGLDYIDIIQVHDMEFAPSLDIVLSETLPALQEDGDEEINTKFLKDRGKVRFIGITGYPLGNFRTVLERTTVEVDTLLTYCRCSLNDTGLFEYMPFFKYDVYIKSSHFESLSHSNSKVQSYTMSCHEHIPRYRYFSLGTKIICTKKKFRKRAPAIQIVQEHGIGVVNASPVSMGLLSHRGPPVWHPAGECVRLKCKEAADYCQSHDVDLSKLALHFTLGFEDIPTTLVSTASVHHLQTNIDAAVSLDLTATEKSCLQHLIENIFKPCGNLSWEGVEVAKYWEKLNKKQKV